MLDQILRVFGIVPNLDLDLMRPGQTPTAVASAVLNALEPILQAECPDWVLVQGDTTTTVAAGLAAFYARARLGHIEAGLRTGDRWLPFPEEMNRRVVTTLADMHFAPTTRARDNLLREAIPAERILVTGNTCVDAVYAISAMSERSEVRELLGSTTGVAPRTILVTAHRRENFGKPLEQICLAVRDLALRYCGAIRVVYSVHRNPQVWDPVHRILGQLPDVALVPPFDYQVSIQFMQHVYLILTDSGGIQEEAACLGKPTLVLRDLTDRPESVEAGVLRVVGTNRARIVGETVRLLEDPVAYSQMRQAGNPFGDGLAASRIVASLLGEPWNLGDGTASQNVNSLF